MKLRWVKVVVAVLFACLALPILALVAMHFRPHAGRLGSTVEIARPPEQVWAWLSEPAKLTQWVGWLTAVESDSTSPDGVGHREVWVMNDPHMPGKPLRLPATITALDPPRSMSGRVDATGAFVGTFTYTLEDLGGRTRVTQVSDWSYAGIGWLMEPLVTPEAQKKERADLERMKTLAEAAPVAAN